MNTQRRKFSLIFLLCLGLISFGLYLQHEEGLIPCPMCILQRYAFTSCGILSLFATLFANSKISTKVFGGAVGIFSLMGASIAARHVWLEHYPPEVFDCGADLEFMVNTFPVGEALPMIFRGTGDCSQVLWSFLGLSIAEWSLIWFAVITILSTTILVSRK
jgi:disulfide bond formation protein DsbB